ncbi:MAG: hypothetical protein DWI22_20335 [Planctomycetota bacterium]|nr:MAG: hypothetical protein DWI22_20335 [Planctomycetota bacterium]
MLWEPTVLATQAKKIIASHANRLFSTASDAHGVALSRHKTRVKFSVGADTSGIFSNLGKVSPRLSPACCVAGNQQAPNAVAGPK